MIRDPELVAQMSKAALVKAEHHDHRAFLRDWRSVIEAVVEQKASRVRFEGVGPRRTPPRAGLAARLPRRFVAPRSWSTSRRTAPRVELDASLHLHGKARPRTLDDVVVSLDAVCDRTGSVVSLPVTVDQRQRTFDVRALIDLGSRLRRARRRGPGAPAAVAGGVEQRQLGDHAGPARRWRAPLRAELCHRRHTDHTTRQQKDWGGGFALLKAPRLRTPSILGRGGG